MDAQIEALLRRARESGRPPFWQLTPELARSRPSLMSLLFGDAPAVQRVSDVTITSAHGLRLQARLYVPVSAPAGLIVFFHGGGWVVGTVDGYHPLTATLANRTGAAVLSVDYRLAPEHPYPAAVQDALAALHWAAANAGQAVGVSSLRLVAMGDSAGANLATVACRLHNKQPGWRKFDFQVLVYPVTSSDFDTGSYFEFAEGNLLTRKDMQWFWNHYVPEEKLRRDPDVSPILAPDLDVSPAAFIVTAGRDPVRDEGEAYGRRLQEFGVPAEIFRADGLVHGFLALIHYSPSAGAAFEKIVSRIRQVIAA